MAWLVGHTDRYQKRHSGKRQGRFRGCRRYPETSLSSMPCKLWQAYLLRGDWLRLVVHPDNRKRSRASTCSEGNGLPDVFESRKNNGTNFPNRVMDNQSEGNIQRAMAPPLRISGHGYIGVSLTGIARHRYQ